MPAVQRAVTVPSTTVQGIRIATHKGRAASPTLSHTWEAVQPAPLISDAHMRSHWHMLACQRTPDLSYQQPTGVDAGVKVMQAYPHEAVCITTATSTRVQLVYSMVHNASRVVLNHSLLPVIQTPLPWSATSTSMHNPNPHAPPYCCYRQPRHAQTLSSLPRACPP